MLTQPDCRNCAHFQGLGTCGRPVPSYWNHATNQRRSRLNVAAVLERSHMRTFGRRRRCGPEGLYFEPAFPVDAPTPIELDTIGDSDGDDGA